MNTQQDPTLTIEIVKPRISIWQKLGGTSLSIALIGHLVLLVIGACWIFRVIDPPGKNPDPFLPQGGGKSGGDTRVDQKKRRHILPATNVKRVIADGAISAVSIPDPGERFGPMAALGSLDGGGLAGGGGGGGGGNQFGKIGALNGDGGTGRLFDFIPQDIRKRCSKEDRFQRLEENGGTRACEDAVVRGLRWLKANQQADGSFEGGGYKVAMTGLALLAYFGHCETPASEEFGDSVTRGITFLVDRGMKNGGRLATNHTGNPWVYEHAIATYALGEAYTFCKELKMDIPNLAEVTEKAGQFIIDNQHDNGGWAYAYNTSKGAHTDLSITGWQVQALKACSHTKIKFQGMGGAITKALRYVESCQNPEGAFGYAGPPAAGASATLTGVGMLCYQMWGKGGGSIVSKGARSIAKNPGFEYNGKSGNLYQHYYESQAMMQRGGDDWKKYNAVFRDQVLDNQNPDGSWKNAGGANHGANPVYNTCLCTLMLEVYYRFLSTDSRGGGRHGGI